LAGASASANDVDAGTTSVRSPQIKLGSAGSTGWTLSFSYAFAHNARASDVDYLRVSVDGQTTPLFIQVGFAGERNATWTATTVDLSAYAGQSIRLLFEAADAGSDSLVEAAIDDVRVYQAPSP
jgi:aminopeptidase S